MPDYPEHDKLRQVADKSQVVGEFVEWLTTVKHFHLAEITCPHGGPRSVVGDGFDCEESKHCRRGNERETSWPARYNIQDLLAEFFGIDRAKLENEKDQILATLRGSNAP